MLFDYPQVTGSSLNETIAEGLARAEEAVAKVVKVDQPRTFENTIRPLELISVELQDLYGRGQNSLQEA